MSSLTTVVQPDPSVTDVDVRRELVSHLKGLRKLTRRANYDQRLMIEAAIAELAEFDDPVLVDQRFFSALVTAGAHDFGTGVMIARILYRVQDRFEVDFFWALSFWLESCELIDELPTIQWVRETAEATSDNERCRSLLLKRARRWYEDDTWGFRVPESFASPTAP